MFVLPSRMYYHVQVQALFDIMHTYVRTYNIVNLSYAPANKQKDCC